MKFGYQIQRSRIYQAFIKTVDMNDKLEPRYITRIWFLQMFEEKFLIQ